MTRKEYELRKIRSNHNELLKAKLIQQITKTYTESMLEIDRKNLSKINQAEPLRIDFLDKFLRSISPLNLVLIVGGCSSGQPFFFF